MKEVQEKYGAMPSSDPEAFSYWLAAILPVSTSVRERSSESLVLRLIFVFPSKSKNC
jgi:hypothetical protein